MSQAVPGVNLAGKAALFNVSLCLGTLEKAKNRPRHLPGIVVFYGPSGFGKSTAAAVAVTHVNAYHVQLQSSWTKKAIYLAILKVMGIAPAKTMYEMGDQIATQLTASKRPLILDDAQYMTAKGHEEIVKDIYESSLGTIMLIGEEGLPGDLKKSERLHGRVLDFAQAQPPSLADAKALRTAYIQKVNIADDLLDLVRKEAKGSVRRILVNLERIQEHALENGLKEIDKAAWGDNELYTGEAPTRRLSA